MLGELRARRLELFRIACDDDDLRARVDAALGCREPDAGGTAGDDDDLAPDGAGEAAVERKIRIEMALPVVPEPPGVILEHGHPDVRALEQALGPRAVEARLPVEELHHVARDPEVAQDRVDDLLQRPVAGHRCGDGRRYQVDQLGVDAKRHRGGVSGAREQVQDLADPPLARIGQVEALPVLARQVREVVHGRDHVVHRHEVDVAALEADQREPGRQRLPHPLDHLEEVVGSVDLVDAPGLRVADDDARPIHAPRPLAAVSHERFRLVLGAEIRMLESGRFLEHVLAEAALVQAGRCDRAHVVEAAGLHAVRELQRMVGADDVREILVLVRRLQVVDRREVEQVIDLAREPAQVRLGHAQVRLRKIALDRHRATRARAPEFAQCLEPLHRLRPHQHEHALAAREQALDEVAADESGRARDEIRHLLLPDRLRLSLTLIP